MATKQSTKHRKPPKFTGKKKPHKRVLIASNWQYPELMQAILDRAADLEWEIIDERFVHMPNAQLPQLDGMLSCQLELTERTHRLRKKIFPMVYTLPLLPKMDIGNEHVVTSDAKVIASMAATHFLERGFKDVGFLHIHSDFEALRTCMDAFGRELLDGGGRLLGHLGVRIHQSGWRDPFQEAIVNWLNKMPRPLGIIASGDIIGGHLVGVCQANGLAVPEEIAVLTIGNKHPWCDMSPCPLSSIDLDPAARGRAAVDLLNRLMQSERPPNAPVRIPPARVVTRKSTDIIAAADLEVAKALRFLWEHYEQQINVDDAAREAGLSRSTLERRFRRAIGHSVNEELLRKRLEHCRELLRTTDLSFVAITPRVGFLSKTYLHRIFLKHHGCTPQQYRKHKQQERVKEPVSPHIARMGNALVTASREP